MSKVLVLTLEYPPQVGGIGIYTREYSKNFDSIICEPSKFGFFYNYFWPRWLKLFFEVRKIVKKEKIKIIHVHHVLPLGYVAYLVKLFYKVDYVVFFHGSDVVISTQNAWKKFWVNFICKNAKKIIINSEALKKQSIEQVGEIMKQSEIVYPALDEMIFEPKDVEKVNKLKRELKVENKKVILTISRIVEGKGHLEFAKAFLNLAHKDNNLVWLVVGDGNKKEELIGFVNKNNLDDKVIFVDNIDMKNLNNFYDLGDVFVLLSHKTKEGREEGFGMSAMFASARGLPVVAGGSGGLVEAVLDGDTGLVVDALQTEKVAIAVLKILEDIDFAKKLGDSGRVRAKEEFTWQKQLEKVKDIL